MDNASCRNVDFGMNVLGMRISNTIYLARYAYISLLEFWNYSKRLVDSSSDSATTSGRRDLVLYYVPVVDYTGFVCYHNNNIML